MSTYDNFYCRMTDEDMEVFSKLKSWNCAQQVRAHNEDMSLTYRLVVPQNYGGNFSIKISDQVRDRIEQILHPENEARGYSLGSYVIY